MGTNAVGAMIVAGPEGFMKTHYRTFNIKGEDLTPGDDFGMMREVLRRRFTRLAKEDEGATAEDPDAFPATPRSDSDRRRPRASSRRRGPCSPISASTMSRWSRSPRGSTARPDARRFSSKAKNRSGCRRAIPALYFVQRLRDEAHRFAIGTHRARRKKEFTRSPLDEIAGVGPARKRALLQAFGTAKAVSRAGLADLEKVDGINSATAKLVYDFFHGERA